MTPTPPAPGRSPQASIGRAAVVGLCGGLLFGGVGLLVIGIRSLLSKPGCEGISKQECELLIEAFAHVGRVQTICGGALIALSLSFFVLVRPYFFSPPAPPPQP